PQWSVFQTPPSIIKRTGEWVYHEISCSHNITNYDVMLWYKREEEQGSLEYLGYMNMIFPFPEDDVKEKISFEGDARKHSRLNISDLALHDSGVYFCAFVWTRTWI
uniref:Ig-like domain-containing protein n=1 Tax=Cyclopterus lumpus TaxID=8103 RepID=A0A8C3A817_CYCLU